MFTLQLVTECLDYLGDSSGSKELGNYRGEGRRTKGENRPEMRHRRYPLAGLILRGFFVAGRVREYRHHRMADALCNDLLFGQHWAEASQFVRMTIAPLPNTVDGHMIACLARSLVC